MAKNIIADSCFWFGLLDKRDPYHSKACKIESTVSVHNVVVPWPSLYESLNTRVMRSYLKRERFKSYIKRSSTKLLDDRPYRDSSLQYVLEQRSTTFSLVDHVIRSMLGDPNISVDALITFNVSDFIDICQSRGIEMIGC